MLPVTERVHARFAPVQVLPAQQAWPSPPQVSQVLPVAVRVHARLAPVQVLPGQQAWPEPPQSSQVSPSAVRVHARLVAPQVLFAQQASPCAPHRWQRALEPVPSQTKPVPQDRLAQQSPFSPPHAKHIMPPSVAAHTLAVHRLVPQQRLPIVPQAVPASLTQAPA